MARGGSRVNAGRKTPSGPYKERTSVIRIPKSIKPDVLVYLEEYKKKFVSEKTLVTGEVFDANILNVAKDAINLARPIYSGKVSAGQSRFPSPAQDYEQEELDLNKHMVKNPPATFLYRVGSAYDSMLDVGILPNAILVVDRSITPRSSHIVLAEVDKELMVKRLYKWKGQIELRSENKEKNYPPITFKEGEELIICGVVTFNVNEFK